MKCVNPKVLLSIFFLFPVLGAAKSFSFNGYTQALPVLIELEDKSYFEKQIQNRLNMRWDLSDELEFHTQIRARFISSDIDKSFPNYRDDLISDPGIMNLSHSLVKSEDYFLYAAADRLYADWSFEKWNIRIGRQRINWGINTLTNPNDLFNIYSMYEYDYPERPGSDALRMTYYRDWATRIELAFMPSRQSRDSVGAALYAFNWRGYDLQLISGYYRERFAVGGGWAGNVGESGFKGEVMLFQRLNSQREDLEESSVVLTSSFDHMFENSLFVSFDALYNSRGGLKKREVTSTDHTAFSADNPSLSMWQVSTQLQYSFNPLLNGALAFVYYPDEDTFFLSPQLSYNLFQDVDIKLFTQHFEGKSSSVLARFGSIYGLSAQWNF